jgi:predicted GNAT family acetyltransferase
MPHEPLDNPVWRALTGPHAGFAEVLGAARRYRPDVSVFAAVDDTGIDAWDALGALVGPAGTAILARAASPVVPPEWTVVVRRHGHQLVLESTTQLPLAPELPIRRLARPDVPQMTALVELTQPGPFRPSTVDLGTYLGVFDDDQLVAMAGERMHVDGYTEISAVCTHPSARRRGLAGLLTAQVARGILARNETPFLHCEESNHDARALYEKLGFTRRGRIEFLILQSPASAA